jgi:hypothetical protein
VRHARKELRFQPRCLRQRLVPSSQLDLLGDQPFALHAKFLVLRLELLIVRMQLLVEGRQLRLQRHRLFCREGILQCEPDPNEAPVELGLRATQLTGKLEHPYHG